MDIRILRYFLTVAKEQNFTKAAEQLNITQPTLSRQLAALEEKLGTTLFIRGSRSITLTETGILLKRRALEMIDLEPINTEGLDYIRIVESDHWVVGMKPDDAFNKLQVSFTSNLGTNAGIMAVHGLGYPVSIEGAAKYWREDLLVQRRLYPEITANTVIAWRRNIPYSLAMNKFIEEINAFEA